MQSKIADDILLKLVGGIILDNYNNYLVYDFGICIVYIHCGACCTNNGFVQIIYMVVDDPNLWSLDVL
jgi:hypothetical protein